VPLAQRTPPYSVTRTLYAQLWGVVSTFSVTVGLPGVKFVTFPMPSKMMDRFGGLTTARPLAISVESGTEPGRGGTRAPSQLVLFEATRIRKAAFGVPTNWMQWVWPRVMAYWRARRTEAATCSDAPFDPVTWRTFPSDV